MKKLHNYYNIVIIISFIHFKIKRAGQWRTLVSRLVGTHLFVHNIILTYMIRQTWLKTNVALVFSFYPFYVTYSTNNIYIYIYQWRIDQEGEVGSYNK